MAQAAKYMDQIDLEGGLGEDVVDALVATPDRSRGDYKGHEGLMPFVTYGLTRHAPRHPLIDKISAVVSLPSLQLSLSMLAIRVSLSFRAVYAISLVSPGSPPTTTE